MALTPLEKMLIDEEDLKLQAYPDSKGFLTIGVGRCIDKRVAGAGLTKEESLYLLRNDIERVRQELDMDLAFTTSRLNEARLGVLEAMVFQLGLPHVLGFHKMITALREGDYETAADEMLDSDWHRNDTPERAERMAKIMRTGEF